MANAPRVSFAIFNGIVPSNFTQPRAMRINIDFTTLATQAFDLQEEFLMAQMPYVQILYVDNTNANAALLTITVQGTQQVIKVKANEQGYFPVLAPESAGFTFSIPAPAANSVNVHFINAPMPAATWLTV
jgi:hypothetical protein